MAYKNKEKAKVTRAAYTQKLHSDPLGKGRALMWAANWRAKRDGRAFDLEDGDVFVPLVCPVLGIPIVLGMKHRLCQGSPSIDRFDNSKGYTKDNIRVISHRANSLKNDATIWEMERVLAYMKGEINCGSGVSNNEVTQAA